MKGVEPAERLMPTASPIEVLDGGGRWRWPVDGKRGRGGNAEKGGSVAGRAGAAKEAGAAEAAKGAAKAEKEGAPANAAGEAAVTNGGGMVEAMDAATMAEGRPPGVSKGKATGA